MIAGVCTLLAASWQPALAQDEPPQKGDTAGAGQPTPEERYQADPELRRRMQEAYRKAQERRRAQSAGGGPGDAAADGQAGNQPSRPRRGGAPMETAPPMRPPDQPGSDEPTVEPPDPDDPLKDVPPEERTYVFSIKDGTYEQLIRGFARQTGMGVIGDPPPEGKVTFVSTQALSYREAIGRVRMLLFKYKPHEPYWIYRRDDHLEVTRVTDFYRVLPRELMFPSVEAMRSADLSEDELALVVYTPQAGSLADLKQVRDFLPDYVRVAPIEGTNSVTIFALVKDIEKYLWLVDFFTKSGSADPRQLVRIEVNNVLPSEALSKLTQLLDLDGSGSTPGRRVVRRPSGSEPSPLEVMPELDTKIIPDDTQGVLLVLAAQKVIDQIRECLTYIDVDLAPLDMDPVIVPVKHADPAQLVTTIQQILSAVSPGTDAGGKSTRRARRRTPSRGQTATTPVSSDGITMFPHPSQKAIVVVGDDTSVDHVRQLVRQFDVEAVVGPLRIPLKHIGASEIQTTITTVLGTGQAKGAPTAQRFQLVPDAADDAFWFSGSEEDLAAVRELVAAIDTPSDPVSLHMATLEHQLPSFAANMLKEWDQASGGAATPGGTPGRPASRAARRRGQQLTAAKFTPDDDKRRLYVLCTESEWQAYVPLIDQLDQPPEARPAFVRLELSHLAPTDAVEQLSSVVGGDPGYAALRFAATEGGVLVMGADDKQLEHVRAFLTELDRPVEIIERVFEVTHADAAEMKTAIETFVGDAAAQGRVRRPRPNPKAPDAVTATVTAELTVLNLGNRLVVRTTPKRMAEVEKLVSTLDVPEPTNETRVYDDFPAGTDLQLLGDTLTTLISGVAGQNPRQRARAGQTGPQFIPMLETNRLIALAPPELFPQIEDLIEKLVTDVAETPLLVEFIDVGHADPIELTEQMRPLLELKVKEIAAEEIPGATPTARAARRRASKAEFHLAADPRNMRIVVAGQQPVIDHARMLVGRFDRPYEEDEIVFKTVTVEHASAPDMVKAVREMMASSAPRRRRVAAKKPGTPAVEEPPPLSVVEAPGGTAVVLHGVRADVDEATTWIERLDAISTSGKKIKVYEIQHADVKMLGELIMNTVETPAQDPRRQVRPRSRRLAQEEEDDDDSFDLTKTWTGQNIYIRADLISDTMVVSSSESVLKQIDEIVAQFDTEEAVASSTTEEVPSFMYELTYADPLDAEWELQMVLDQLWAGADRPRCTAAMFGDYLICRHTDPDQFPKIKELIAEYVDKIPKEDLEIKRKAVLVPQGMRPADVARWLKLNYGDDYNIEIIEAGSRVEQTHGLEVVKAPPTSGGSQCFLPATFSRLADQLTAAALAQRAAEEPARPEGAPTGQDSGDRQQEPPANPEPSGDEPPEPTDPLEPPPDEPSYDEDILDAAADSMIASQPSSQVEPEADDDGEKPRRKKRPQLQGQKVNIYVDDQGNLIAEAPGIVIDQIPDWISELQSELEGQQFPPDIRIVRLRYVDVNYAAEILEEMFNATRQQRAAVAAAQRRAQQIARQRQQQQRQQQQQQQQQRSDDDDDPRRRQQQQQQQQQQPQVPQLPDATVRVFPNPRDRTLILRADTNQYPVIFELLATIDQPKPIDAELRVFPLEKLNAAEVEELLTEMLQLDQAGTTRRTRRPGRSPAGSSGAGASLPRTVLQKTVTGTNELNVDPADIQLSANEAANAIVVMAPPSALDFIGELIKQLESGDIPEREPRYFELQHADVTEVVEYLEQHYEKSGAPGRKGRSRDAGAQSLSTPSFVPYPRLSMITALATADQLEEIAGIIERLDVSSEEEQWRDVSLSHADARFVADTLTAMFASGARGAAGGRDRSAPGLQPVFIGEDGGRMLFYRAPEALREDILAMVQKLDEEAKDAAKLRVIQLQHGEPSRVVEAIERAFGARGGGRAGRAMQRTAPFTLAADDGSKQLFVMADEATFARIESLATQLDKPATFDFEFRIFPLQHADARRVHEVMNKLITDYLRRLGGGARAMEAFSVEVDQRSNSLIVLGGPVVFAFVEENLARIDNPANAASPPSSLMIALKNARAEEIAGTINRMYAQRARERGEEPPMAEANRGLNLLMLRGTKEQINEIQREVLDPLKEHAAAALTTETFTLRHADPQIVADAINQIFEDMRRAYQNLGPAASPSPTEFTVMVTPLSATNQVIVQASEENMPRIEARISELDREDVAARSSVAVKMYPIENADPDAVARIINEWGRSRQQGGRRPGQAGDVVQAASEPITQRVVVTATESNHMIIQDIIAGLDAESTAARDVHTVKLGKADAEDLVRPLQEIYRNRSQGRRGAGVQITAEPATNSLVINANASEMEELRTLIAQLDVEPDASRQLLRSVKLQHADVFTVAQAITDLSRSGALGRDPRDQVAVVPEPGSRSLVVAGSPETMRRVEELVAQLDTEEGARQDVHVVSVNNADAAAVAQTVSEIFIRNVRQPGNQPPPVTVAALSGTRAVVVKAGPEDFAEIKTMIEQLDRDEAMLGEAVRIIPLLYADAQEVEQAVRNYLQPPGGRGRGAELAGDMRVSVLPQSNAVVISGDAKSVERIASLVGELDQAGEEGSVPQIIALEHANVGQILPSLQEMFATPTGARRGQPPPVINGNEALNAVVVRASRTDLTAIRDIVEKLDTADAAQRKAFRLVKVPAGVNVEDLAAKVEESVNNGARQRAAAGQRGQVPSITVAPDRRTGSLIVSGNATLFNEAEELATALVDLGPQGDKATKIITLSNVAAEDVERAITLLRGEEPSQQRRPSGGSSRRRR